ncbi:hypothetical protein D020_0298 [Vibrio parahaemolyticus SBR10290]|nr:hypothetical protein D019_2811 [Vibrio parahaemolyticus VP2007-095]EQL84327.1 hypothetical protein D052_0252 [Vibrio parahaemolyticus 10290]EQL85857.1 hypothetical protein D036_3891 [Vibrio parahaemolyticus VP232]EQM16475.1 hypothetical protein D024_4897 [Vibrio parahaemolyticus 3259]EQM44506.1 hypothetical protein D042_4293 [Vibrio parahaemolyticus NIHCB0757]ESW45492.1 hypothetical protein D022_0811 [Vibrio parahaemolyticus 12310]ETT22956.1 hypothetical protein D023_0292 [Vibrio parahaemo
MNCFAHAVVNPSNDRNLTFLNINHKRWETKAKTVARPRKRLHFQ